MRASPATLLASTLAGLGACERAPVPAPPDAAGASAAPAVQRRAPVPFAARPGDSLLDRLPLAVVATGRTNLPPAIARRFESAPRMRSRTVEPAEWIEAGPVPPRINELLAPDHRVRFWKVKPAVHVATAERRVIVHLAGVPVERPAEELLPGWRPPQGAADRGSEQPAAAPAIAIPALWWDERIESLFALSEQALAGASIEYRGDPSAELPGIERLRAGGEPVAPAALAQRVEIGEESRAAVALPAPGTLAFALAAVESDELHFAVAVVDQAFRADGEFLEPALGGSDGVTFRVEVEADGRRETVWSLDLGRERVGREWIEARADLVRFRGRPVVLRLVSAPGPDGDDAFDYAVWAGLRLRGGATRAPRMPHVVLIDVDTLRADRLGCYGSPRATSPGIDAWAAREAVVYRDVLATAPWTLPSTASMMTGLYVHQHGVDQFPRALHPATPTLATLLAAAGYECFAITEGGYVRAAFGFGSGFDVYRSARYKSADWEPALEWVRQRGSERPFFLFLHTYLVHAPYPSDPRFESECEPPYDGVLAGKAVGYDNVIEPFNRRALELSDGDRAYANRLYDALVARADRVVSGFLSGLEPLLGGEDVLVVITSDHGEELFEHGQMGHGQSLYDELLRVPMIVSYPRSLADRPAGVVDATPASSVDLLPTVLDAAGLPPPGHLPGRSLLRPADEPAPRLSFQNVLIESIAHAGYKLIRRAHPEPGAPRGATELYELAHDPGERSDLARSRRDLVERFETLLDRVKTLLAPAVAGGAPDTSISADAKEQLRALGYLLGGDGG